MKGLLPKNVKFKSKRVVV